MGIEKENKKILYVITHGNRGGAQTHVRSLAIGAASAGHEVVVGMGTHGWLQEELEGKGIRTVHFEKLARSWNPFSSLLFAFELRQFLQRERFDVVHVHSSNAMFGLLSGIRLPHPPGFIATIHGWSLLHPGWEKSPAVKFLYGLVMRLLLSRAHKVIYVCESDRRIGEQLGVKQAKGTVIHNGIAPQARLERMAAREELGYTQDDTVIGTIARFDYAKNLSLLLEAAKKLKDRGWKWCLIGSGPLERDLQTFVSEHGLEETVTLTQKDQASRLLPAFDLFVLSSRYEGFPYTLLEAGLAGVPVVAMDVGGVSELIEDGITGRCVPRGNLTALTTAIEEFMFDAQARSACARQLAQRVQNAFTEQQMVTQTLEVYS